MYINPDNYKEEDLHEADKRLLAGFDVAVEALQNREYIIDDVLDFRDEYGTIGKIQREVADRVFDAIEEYLAGERFDLIVSIMDGDESYYEGFEDKGGEQT